MLFTIWIFIREKLKAYNHIHFALLLLYDVKTNCMADDNC